ncbi:MAG: TonB-dependent receptor [Bacteroidales bacterium]|nr:TonB-dependent receptor [Bacteroidales bacterium]
MLKVRSYGLLLMLTVLSALPLAAVEQSDTIGLYRDRTDSLSEALTVSATGGNFLSKRSDLRTEVISASGLCKMACCNLAESFENSASVTVGYSDAVTGARQIRLLGLSGIYTQMLDENRPIMRGIGAPFGLSYIPGQWLESIQIAKGASSVINGLEGITGLINMEHRKPTDEKPLFVNASVMSDTKADLNVASSLQLNDYWSTVILGHASGNFYSMDHNKDFFMDDPLQSMFSLSNRWLYYAPDGMQVRFGVKALHHRSRGGEIGANGQPAYQKSAERLPGDKWGTDITNTYINGYLKVGIPLNEDNSQNIAVVADGTWQRMDAWFGTNFFAPMQSSAFVNLLYQNQMAEMHHFTLGLTGFYDGFSQLRSATVPFGNSRLGTAGAFGEYTFHFEEKFTAIAGLHADWYAGKGFKLSPRVTLKYEPVEGLVLRANGGRGLRYSHPLTDHIGVFSTAKTLQWNFSGHPLEDAWTFGGNATVHFPLAGREASVSFDYFRTQFTQQVVVDYERFANTISLYQLRSLTDGRSFTDNYQLDFSCEPVERFTVSLTARYTNARCTYALPGLSGVWRGQLREQPMVSRTKAVLNLQYATQLRKWIFDFTASLNGSARVYDFMTKLTDADGRLLYPSGRTPVYPMLYLQVTRRFKGCDVYLGGENLTNFTQKHVILGTRRADGSVDTSLPDFDASCVWGPLMGIKVYAGVRITLWKTN